MNQTISKLQAAIYVGTIIIVLLLVLIFWGVIPGLREAQVKGIVIFWGTEPEAVFQEVLSDFGNTNKNIAVRYVRKDLATYETEVVNALASGAGPDLWMIPHTWITRHENKLFPVPATLMTEREFNDTFANIARDVFIMQGKILALPLFIDPLVLFSNRDFFASDAIPAPPKTWDQFLETSMKLTRYGADESIVRAGTAMGLASNIPEVKDIVSLLIMQGGTDIVNLETRRVTLGEAHVVNDVKLSPTDSALRFYTDFARRAKKSYTWNATLPDPVTLFSKEKLAMFIGYARNLEVARKLNPHLAIDVSPVPQFTGAPIAIGYARMQGVTVSLASPNRIAAWTFAKYLTNQVNAFRIAERTGTAPSRRDVLQEGHAVPARSVIYESAVRAKTWLDPQEMETSRIFASMIESILRGASIEGAAGEAANRIRQLIK